MHVSKCLAVVLLLLASMIAHAGERQARVDAALASAAEYLAARQSTDGTWRSDHYRTFDDGTPLTPHVLSTLMFLRHPSHIRAACERGKAFLLGSVDADGGLVEPFASMPYPSYTAAEIVWCVSLDPPLDDTDRRVQAAWLAIVRQRQFNADLGWESSDTPFGGWGYGPLVARKPKPDAPFQPAAAPNLSATVFAIGALRSGHVPADDPVWRDTRHFIERCQNYRDADAGEFDDGGFFFSPVDPAGNKAGVAGVDADGRTRFASYGSMTADGIRALLQCGADPDHPRVVAARHWLERNFTVTTNPGRFADDREVLREATYYYYTWSLAHALSRLRVRHVEVADQRIDWVAALADELMKRQNDDGSWTNRFTDSREDDPLVATPFAAAALAICRERMKE